MWVIGNKADGAPLVTSGLVWRQGEGGPEIVLVPMADAIEAALTDPDVAAAGITAADQLFAVQITDLAQGWLIVDAWPGRAAGSLLIDQVAGTVNPNPAWTPPPPPPDPLAEFKEIVDKNLLASEHDRRWLEQKEAAKRLGILWIKGHPACAQAEAEAALAAEFPADPLVVSPAGVIDSYARAAADRGHIASPSFEDLRDLVAATPESQLAKLLAKR